MRHLDHPFLFAMAAAGLGLAAVCCVSLTVPTAAVAQVVTTEEDRAREAQRERDLRAREAGQADVDRRYDRHHRSELYVAGFGGYTFGHGFNNIEGTGLASGTDLGDIGLKNSGVYGAKLGYFLPDRLNWLGFEVEASTRPRI